MNGCMVDMNWPDQTFLLFFELKANLENRDLWFSFPPAIQQFLILLPNFSPARYSVSLWPELLGVQYSQKKNKVNGTIRLFKSDWVKNYVCWNSASIIFHLLREAVVHPSFTTKICFSHIGIFALEVKDLRKLLYYSSGEISHPLARKKLGILFYKQRKNSHSSAKKPYQQRRDETETNTPYQA